MSHDALRCPHDFKKYPMSCHLFLFSCRLAICGLSILRNRHVGVSVLSITGHTKGHNAYTGV